MDQASFNEFGFLANEKTIDNGFYFNAADSVFEAYVNEDSITAQKRRNYLMEVNEEFDIQVLR